MNGSGNAKGAARGRRVRLSEEGVEKKDRAVSDGKGGLGGLYSLKRVPWQSDFDFCCGSRYPQSTIILLKTTEVP